MINIHYRQVNLLKANSIFLIVLIFLNIGCLQEDNSSYKILAKFVDQKSEYFILIEDYDYYFWAVLYYKNALSPVCNSFLWSNKNPLPEHEMPLPFNGNPPITEKYASINAVVKEGLEKEIEVIWDKTGKIAVILLGNKPICILDGNNKKSYSKSIAKSGPYGIPWDERIYNKIWGRNGVSR